MTIHPSLGRTLPTIFRFRSPTPLLQHLDISGFPRGHIPRLPHDFLGRHVPSLRSLIWDDSSLLPAPFPPPNLTHLSSAADEAPTHLHVVLGLISSAPLLERLSISIIEEDISLHPFPLHDIRLDSLRYLRLVSGASLSRVLPRFRVPQLKEFSLLLPSIPFDLQDPTIAALLPSDSYPLLTKVTSMDFYAGPGDSQVKLSGEGIKVTMGTFLARMDNFFVMQSFPFTQITRLIVRMIAKPVVVKIREFTNLEQLGLVRCQEDAEVFLALSPPPGPVSLVPCPRLVAMRVAFYRSDPPTVDSFKQMVRSRKGAGNPLVNINLMSFHGMGEMLDIDEFNEWVTQSPFRE